MCGIDKEKIHYASAKHTDVSTAGLHTLKSFSFVNRYFEISKMFLEKARILEDQATSIMYSIELQGLLISSFIFAVMSLEAFINEDCGPFEDIQQCSHKTHNSPLARKICARLSQEVPEEMLDIYLLRNEYIHYDFEAMGSKTFIDPELKKVKRLMSAIDPFVGMISDNKFSPNQLYNGNIGSLYPFGILSCSFIDYVRATVYDYMQELKKLGMSPSLDIARLII